MKGQLSEFIKNMSKCLNKWIKVDKLNYFKINQNIWKIIFILDFYQYIKSLEGKIRKCIFFDVEIF